MTLPITGVRGIQPPDPIRPAADDDDEDMESPELAAEGEED